MACDFDIDTGRPIVGVVNICPGLLSTLLSDTTQYSTTTTGGSSSSRGSGASASTSAAISEAAQGSHGSRRLTAFSAEQGSGQHAVEAGSQPATREQQIMGAELEQVPAVGAWEGAAGGGLGIQGTAVLVGDEAGASHQTASNQSLGAQGSSLTADGDSTQAGRALKQMMEVAAATTTGSSSSSGKGSGGTGPSGSSGGSSNSGGGSTGSASSYEGSGSPYLSYEGSWGSYGSVDPSPRPSYSPLSGKALDSLVHELVHALGFNAGIFPSFSDPSTGLPYMSPALTKYAAPSGSVTPSLTFLSTPLVTQQARAALSCESLPGGQLENEGGASNALHHWEFRLFYQDLMTPYFLATLRSRVTPLTLAALQDSGWYTPRWEYAQPFDSRLVSGCSLALSTCTSFQASQPGMYYCSGAGQPLAQPCAASDVPQTCMGVTPFSDGCSMLRPDTHCSDAAGALTSAAITSSAPVVDLNQGSPGTYLAFGAYYGSDSRCLPWSATGIPRRAGCFQVSESVSEGVDT
jgi:hypothetical protein